MQTHGLDFFMSRHGSPSALLLVFGLGFAILALLFCECLLKARVAANFLGFLYYREEDRLSHPIPSLGFIWSSIGAYLMLGSYFRWQSRYDDMLTQIGGLAIAIHVMLQLVLYVRYEHLSPTSEPIEEVEESEDEIIAVAVEEQLERSDKWVALFKKERVPLDEPRMIEVHFLAPDKPSAETLVTELKQNQFKVLSLSHPPEGFETWSVTALHYTSIEDMTNPRTVERFVRIARKCGCDHDGWGMPLHRIEASPV